MILESDERENRETDEQEAKRLKSIPLSATQFEVDINNGATLTNAITIE